MEDLRKTVVHETESSTEVERVIGLVMKVIGVDIDVTALVVRD